MWPMGCAAEARAGRFGETQKRDLISYVFVLSLGPIELQVVMVDVLSNVFLGSAHSCQ